jgi:hypothetical protein
MSSTPIKLEFVISFGMEDVLKAFFKTDLFLVVLLIAIGSSFCL